MADMQGKRVELIPQPGGFQLLKPGEYGKWTDGTWYACTPNDHGANLSHALRSKQCGPSNLTVELCGASRR